MADKGFSTPKEREQTITRVGGIKLVKGKVVEGGQVIRKTPPGQESRIGERVGGSSRKTESTTQPQNTSQKPPPTKTEAATLKPTAEQVQIQQDRVSTVGTAQRAKKYLDTGLNQVLETAKEIRNSKERN